LIIVWAVGWPVYSLSRKIINKQAVWMTSLEPLSISRLEPFTL
jgi:hypothetical protein